MVDIHNALITTAYAPAAVAASGTTTGTAIDLTTLNGFSEICFILTTTAVVDTGNIFFIRTSDASGGTYADVTGATITLTSNTAGTYLISIRLNNAALLRFVRVSYTTATATSRTVSVVAVGLNPSNGVRGSTEAARATSGGLVARALI
jgi:hypothetical protein